MARIEVGTTRALSLPRKLVCDFLAASATVPTVTIGRTIDVRTIADARRRAVPRPSWCALFTKAFAAAAAETPELRQAYLSFPTARIYQHTTDVAAIVVECDFGGEQGVAQGLISRPNLKPLREIDESIVAVKNDPLGTQKMLRRAYSLGRLPQLLRRLIWWQALNISGYRRARWLGTFGVTSVAGLGADSLRPLSPWTALLHYGVVDADGRTTLRLTYDHRVMDGTPPALALQRTEKALHELVLPELLSLAPPAAAA